jgi:hypothetical protein
LPRQETNAKPGAGYRPGRTRKGHAMLSRLLNYHDPGQTERRKRIYAAYELWYTVVDVGAAICFLAGSLLFLSEETKAFGTYLFIAGSVLFLMKPAIRLLREVRYAANGEIDTLAHRSGWNEPRSERS